MRRHNIDALPEVADKWNAKETQIAKDPPSEIDSTKFKLDSLRSRFLT